MLLKKLELIGFKSFADKTEFVFGPGITALVGPNGCGKSNVVDAVKWILGEQSVKSLRGTEMADIIFNGTGPRKSLGFAEATVTFDNTDRKLALDFDEVTITRRVHRSGEGEYFINRQPCRLKDIKNLLLDTGIGMQCYSVIEQGKIDQILVSSTAERRRVFDEAAGISKYKSRRKEAQSRLERVEQNLQRLHDITAEVEKQLRSVKYQAAKARRYREYTDELKRLRVSYSLKEYDGYSKHAAQAGERLRVLEDEHTRLLAESDRVDAARSECELKVIDLERSQESAQSVLAELRQAALAAEDAIRFNQTRIREQTELQTRYEQNLLALEGRVEQMRTELAEHERELEALVRQLEEEQGILDGKADDLTRTDYEERQVTQELAENKGAVVGLMQQTSQLENELSVVRSEQRTMGIRGQQQAARLSEVVAELNQGERAVHRAAEEIDALDRIVDQLKCRTEEKLSERRELGCRLDGLREELTGLLQHRSSLTSRLEVLCDLDEKQEGIEQGVREVLAALREGGAETNGLHGMLGEQLQVQEQYARAVEAALGHRAQTLVVESLDHAVHGVRVVNESGKGRASFLPMSHCKVKGNGHPLPGGTIGRLKDFIECDDRHRTVVECLLGDVLLVEDLGRACELKATSSNGYTLVTLAGEVIEPSGMITGGRGISGGGIISRTAERRAVQAQLEQVRTQITEMEQTLSSSRQTETAITEEVERLAELAEREKTTRSAKLTSIERLREKQALLGEERDVLVSEQAELEREGAELEERGGELRRRLDEVKREDEELESRIETLTRSHQHLSSRRLALQEEMTELKVKLARSRQQQEGLRSAIDNLGANLRIREGELDELRANIEEGKRRQSESREEIVRREAELAETRRKHQEQQCVVLGLTNSREGLREEMTALEKKARELKGRLAELDTSLGELRLEAQEIRIKMESLVERVREDYELDLRQMYEGWQEGEMNWDEVAERIEELRRKIGNMGNVNLDAIENEEALARRAEFLTSQRDDLLSAKRQLEDIIGKLNKQSLEMFEKSFAVVRENFQEMFRKLFGGGKADLFLVDEQDVLESGIEIIARPPGKEPRAISLLSGGEKVLTAVALLFAIFKAKPSPFCLLDEVDAALDEANIGRFSNILQEFLVHSHFIIITHSKRTMAIANVIYGITMQESGVSKKISVKFADYEQQVA